MKLKLIVTLACVSLAMAACAKKDSYRTGAMGSTSNVGQAGGGDTSFSNSEQNAIDTLASDETFSNISDTPESQEFKAEALAVEGEQLPIVHSTQGGGTTGKFTMQLTILDKNSKNCKPKQIVVPAFSEQDLKSDKVKIEGVGRLVCNTLDGSKDCNNILLILEKSDAEASLVATTAVRLAKDENGVYRPEQNESDVFANATSVDDGIKSC